MPLTSGGGTGPLETLGKGEACRAENNFIKGTAWAGPHWIASVL